MDLPGESIVQRGFDGDSQGVLIGVTNIVCDVDQTAAVGSLRKLQIVDFRRLGI